LVVAVLYTLIFIFPMTSKLSDVSAEVMDISEKMNFVNKSIVKMAHRKELLEKLTEELNSYAGGLPNEKEISVFLESIAAMARDSGVKIIAITPADLKPLAMDKTDVNYYYELPISIIAKSGYHELGEFIGEIEKGKRFMTIEGLKIQDNKSTPRKHNVRMLLNTYVSAGEKEVQ